MEKLRETCLELLKTHNIQKNIIQPIICSIYNEIYLYIWFFFIYHLLFCSYDFSYIIFSVKNVA